METSYNGWTASQNPADFGGIQPLVVAGESFAPGVRKGDVHTVLGYVAEQMHKRVEPIVRPDWHQQDDWGYSYRQNRNAANLSCHSSATAIDYNATRHPNGKRGTFTAAQVAEIRKILAEVAGTVRWGGDFTGTPDEMHFEIVKPPGDVARVAVKLRNSPAAAIQEEDDMPDEATFKRWVREATHHAALNDAGDFGSGPGFLHFIDHILDIKRGVADLPRAVVDRPVGPNKEPLFRMVQTMAERQAASTKLLEALASKDPAAIAGQIPADLARQVADELGKRLAV